jgi:hypothetical protein
MSPGSVLRVIILPTLENVRGELRALFREPDFPIRFVHALLQARYSSKP